MTSYSEAEEHLNHAGEGVTALEQVKQDLIDHFRSNDQVSEKQQAPTTTPTADQPTPSNTIDPPSQSNQLKHELEEMSKHHNDDFVRGVVAGQFAYADEEADAE